MELHLHQLLILPLEAFLFLFFLRRMMKTLLSNLHLYPWCSIKPAHLHIEKRHLYTIVYLAHDPQSEYNVILLL